MAKMGKPMFSFGRRHHQLDDFQLLFEPCNFFLFNVFPYPEWIRRNIRWNLRVLLDREGSIDIRSISIDFDHYTNLVFIEVNNEILIFDECCLFLETRFRTIKKLGKMRNTYCLLINNEYHTDVTIAIMD
jgi:hypothetical protein